uniref:NB-ARC domain-containing protein n=1 Tax=Aegilops tauschii subsp. strangulata TaxID=200361 RepID=A0A453A752_AEGTS
PVVGPGGMGKTTPIQHIYRSQKVQNHLPVMIWICVSLSFNLESKRMDGVPVTYSLCFEI